MAKKKQADKLSRLEEPVIEDEDALDADDGEDVEDRRKARKQELAAREAERKRAWKEHEAARKEAEERRKASEPDKEFAEAARKAKERLENERIDLHRRGYEAESRRRNPDEKLEKRFRDKHADVLRRHLGTWATLQEISQGADVNATREALQVMARAWKEKEDLLLALARAKKGKKADESTLEARTESLKEKLASMEESRRKATPKPPKRKKAAPKKRARAPEEE